MTNCAIVKMEWKRSRVYLVILYCVYQYEHSDYGYEFNLNRNDSKKSIPQYMPSVSFLIYLFSRKKYSKNYYKLLRKKEPEKMEKEKKDIKSYLAPNWMI